MTGRSVKAFADFELATGAAHTRSPDDLINAAAAFQRFVWPRVWRNNKSKAIRAGDEIDFPIVFEDNGTYENRLPGQWHDYSQPQLLKRGVLDWRFSLVHKAWNEKMITLNDKIRYGTRSAVVDEFVRISKELETTMQTAAANGIERDLWAPGDYDQMENPAIEGKKPMSLWAHINPEPNGLYGSDTGGGATTGLTAFSQLQRLVPSDTNYTAGNYKPQLVTYDSIAQDNPGNIIAGLEELFDLCHFMPPETMKQYFNDPAMNNLMILVSRRFLKLYRTLIRGGQDRFAAGPQDPSVNSPLFRGIPVQWAPPMDTSAVYKTNGAGARVTEGQTTASNANIYGPGPRAMLLNFNYLFMTFYEGEDGGFIDRREPSNHHNQFDNWVVPCEITWNLLDQNRRMQGFLTPAKNTALVSAY